MGLEDALALNTSDRRLQEALTMADERMLKHEENESSRIQFGLPTDFDRWIKTGLALD